MTMSLSFARASLAVGLLTACVAASALAQDQKAPPVAPPEGGEIQPFALPPVPDIAKDFTDAKKSPEAVKAAEEALKATAAAYRNAKSYSDTYTLTVEAMGQKQTQSMTIARDAKNMRLEMSPAVFMAANDKVYVFSATGGKNFKSFPIGEGMIKTLEKELGSFGLPMPRWSYDMAEAKDLAMELAGGFMPGAKLAGFDAANGGSVLVMGDGGSVGVFSIDPTTKLISGAKLNLAPPGAPPGFMIPVTIATKPVVADALATPIVFDEKSMTPVESIDEVFGGAAPESKAVKVGDAAPAFSLSTLDGKTVTLAELKGKVVVVDFWAEWCGPCKRGLPHISEFAKWAKGSGKAIEVYGINTLERTKGDERMKATGEFWKKQGFVMPCLVDMDDAVINAYGFDGIPATVVIGPDGKIAAIHNGIDGSNPGKIVDQLKQEVEKAFSAKSEPMAPAKGLEKPATEVPPAKKAD